VEVVVKQMGIKADLEHAIFDAWKSEPAGPTLFKAVAVFSATITAPLAEELVFRGILQRLLQQLLMLPWLAILLTSLAFAAMHQPWTLRPPIFLLSLVLGWAYFRTGNILVPLVAHAVFNAVEFALFMVTMHQQ
jgi:membrane protease YdiL (CAAX protease family)